MTASDIAPVRARRTALADEDGLREVFATFATGVTVVAATDPSTGRPFGFTTSSFTSVALDPPLILLGVDHAHPVWARVRDRRYWSVNVLAERHTTADPPGDGLPAPDWSPSPHGAPVFDGALAWLECSLEAEHRMGGRLIVVARVGHLDTHAPGRPLVRFRDRRGTFTT
ncbi:flavin reductase family protein [Streptomyces qinzhouensis]|uniref:Flavin reductase family protein n=1 Tax=Streptomyces qinzhouensis TaxID=2599401 RepID=A0A5B8IS25_9ACTN|nr:flavin reductase family protein [Streptomyces qinzhouensis]QDY80449.1 flavin reductase family protein [Streptomyces qinzhouensis]